MIEELIWAHQGIRDELIEKYPYLDINIVGSVEGRMSDNTIIIESSVKSLQKIGVDLKIIIKDPKPMLGIDDIIAIIAINEKNVSVGCHISQFDPEIHRYELMDPKSFNKMYELLDAKITNYIYNKNKTALYRKRNGEVMNQPGPTNS